jgi:hypothetical protein
MEPSASSTVLIPLSKSKKTHRGEEAGSDEGSSWDPRCALLSSVYAISGSPKAATTRGTNKDRVFMCITLLAEPVRAAIASALVRRDPWALSFRCNGRLHESGCSGDRMEWHMVIWLAAKVHQRAQFRRRQIHNRCFSPSASRPASAKRGQRCDVFFKDQHELAGQRFSKIVAASERHNHLPECSFVKEERKRRLFPQHCIGQR